MRAATLFIFFLYTLNAANAADAFIGGGLITGNQTLGSSGQSDSKFISQGYCLEGGFLFKNGQISAEYGSSNTKNTLASQTYLEVGALDYYTAKAGLKFGKFGIGAGYRHNEVSLKSLSLTGSNYLESRYEGWTPIGFVNLELSSAKAVRTLIEGQYVTGDLESSVSSLPKISFTEMAISIRIFISID